MVHFKCVNCMVYKLYLNKVVKKKKTNVGQLALIDNCVPAKMKI